MYKGRELRLKKNGYYDLATEVIRQWNTDGRPRGDMEGVRLWAELLQSHQKIMTGVIKHGELKGVRRK